MNDREAIATIKEYRPVFGWKQYREALDTAISALQEREERSRGCAYCYTDAKHNPFVSGYNFCHNCGRPLENNFEE